MALELVGGALLSAFLQVAFEKLSSPQVLDFFRGRKIDETLLNKLETKLLSVHALADDAEYKQFTDPHVRNWLLKVKDVVLDAEDILDEIQCYITKTELDAEAESQTCTACTCKVSNLFKSSHFSSFNKEIKSRMEQVLENLEFLSRQKSDLGLKQASGVGSGFGSKVSHKSSSTSSVVESVIYGREDDKEMIFNWLTSDPGNANQLSILSIVGMGGLGKTTLAQHVYNDPRIENKFDIRAWVCVSDEFDVFNVTKTILEAINKSTDDSRNREMAEGRLKEKLSGKRFLLVLDDVWNRKQKEWKQLQTPLNHGAQGSKIVVTTRDMKVASVVASNVIQTLSELKGDHCWQLFSKHAFQDDNHQPDADYKEIGMKIVEKCKGLPLALTTIGSLLHQKSSISEWESILRSEIWEISEEDSDIVPALRLSYLHLPPQLKRCFAYCALFPKDCKFDKRCLIQLWMVENFLQCGQQSKSPEEVGEEYFNDLLSRSFFQQQSWYGDKTYFIMHDLLSDLAKYVCGDLCFRLEIDEAKNIPKSTRHFSIVINHAQYFDGFGTLYDTKRLRTFMPTSGNMCSFNGYYWNCKMLMHEMFSKFKFLRTLSLSNSSNLTEVPDSVCNLKHLRWLDLSNTDINKLPEATCSLYNLKILKLNNCKYLEELPPDFHKLANLRCLEFIQTNLRKVPEHLGKLKNLQVFMSLFNVGRSREFSIQQLGQLNLHGILSIGMLQNIENPSDALAVDLKNKTYLVELELNWGEVMNHADSTEEKDEDVIENLQPSKNMEKLSIRNYAGKRFPSWLSHNSLLNIRFLELKNCKSCQLLPPLGLFPSLKKLKISGLDGIVDIDVEFYGNGSSSFISLETLMFSDMKKWEKWECKAVKGAFPRLKDLSIESCPKLKGNLPLQLVCLQTLQIKRCEQLEASAPIAPELRGLDLAYCGKLQIEYGLTTLEELTVNGDSMDACLMERVSQMISDSSCFEMLNATCCPNMKIPMNYCHDFLVKLSIDGGCDSLTIFQLDFFPKLWYLYLSGCPNLERISQEHANNELKVLTISMCPQLASLPECMHLLLPSLDSLTIGCPQLESFSDGGLPSNLKNLSLYSSSKLLASLDSALGPNPSLESLVVGNVDVESFPEKHSLPLSLFGLHIEKCKVLKRLDYVALCHLSSLKKLIIDDCPNLQCLPEEGLPNSISRFEIRHCCPLLKKRCKKPDGEDWPKIAHIQTLFISEWQRCLL